MKKIIKKGIVLILGLMVFTSCNDDFLDRVPLDELSEDSFLNTSTDLQTYVNSLYSVFPRYHWQGGAHNAFADGNSDLLIRGSSITGSLDNAGDSGSASIDDSNWNSRYDRIRRINYFIVNSKKVNPRDDAADQYIGEGYFFRAWNYFQFLERYGGVPYITKPLNISSEELYTPRSSRNELAKAIIKDLDSAIVNLFWKNSGPARPGRVTKEAAMVMKARVALFEGTWERYHGAKSTVFQHSGSDGTEFLALIEPTINPLIDRHGGNIFNGGGLFNEPYNQINVQLDGASTAGAFLYRQYDHSITAGHNFYDIINNIGASSTKRFVDFYLDKNGLPQSLSPENLMTLNDMGQNLDPRFRQTIWTPDRGRMLDLPGRTATGNSTFRYPNISSEIVGGNTNISTGYRRWKGAIFDATRYRAGTADDILIRYGEGLLALAEAKAILGSISQSDLDKTVNVLRSRVNMTPMNLSTLNGWNINYSASTGFNPSESNIVNEIRRERTIELALEGFRLNDLKRWAVYDDAINGYKPKGARIQEFLDYFNDPAALVADGYTGSPSNQELIPGSNIGADVDGFLNPYYKSSQFQDGGVGFFIEPSRDYLNAIPSGQIDLYSVNGVTLEQNPGWN